MTRSETGSAAKDETGEEPMVKRANGRDRTRKLHEVSEMFFRRRILPKEVERGEGYGEERHFPF